MVGGWIRRTGASLVGAVRHTPVEVALVGLGVVVLSLGIEERNDETEMVEILLPAALALVAIFSVSAARYAFLAVAAGMSVLLVAVAAKRSEVPREQRFWRADIW